MTYVMLMLYPVTALPPSVAGADHEMIADVAVMLPTLTLCGTPGTVAVDPFTVKQIHVSIFFLHYLILLYRRWKSSRRGRSLRRRC
jgi:hypothetical protein